MFNISTRNEWMEGPVLHPGAAFFPSGLQLSRSKRTMELNGHQPLLTRKVPHVSLPRQSFKKEGKERKHHNLWERSCEGGKAHKKGGGDGKRRKRDRVRQFVHVFAAQTADNETEVDGRPTALLMEQLKWGLTTHWLSHAMASRQLTLETLQPYFNNYHGLNTFSLFFRKKLYCLLGLKAFLKPKNLNADICTWEHGW